MFALPKLFRLCAADRHNPENRFNRWNRELSRARRLDEEASTGPVRDAHMAFRDDSRRRERTPLLLFTTWLTQCIRRIGLVVQLVMACAWSNVVQSQDIFPGTDISAVEPWPYSHPRVDLHPQLRFTQPQDAPLRPGYSDVKDIPHPVPVLQCVHNSPMAECRACRYPARNLVRNTLIPEAAYPVIHSNEVVEHISAPDRCRSEPLALKTDLPHAWYRLRDDALAVYGPGNLLTLALAGAASATVRDRLDDDVRRDAATHPGRWGVGGDVLGVIGSAEFQVPIVLGVYALSLHRQDSELRDFSATLTSAFTINGLSTLVVKGVTDTNRPSSNFNDGRWGFPSYHASSSFTIAGVVDEYFGHRVGFPAYVLSGLIGWSRIDERDHDLSDVVFGSAMGFVIGKSVARHELTGDSRVRLIPWTPPLGGTGLGLQVSY